MRNPLIQLGFEIPFDQIEAVHVEPAIDALLTEAQAAVDAIAANDEPRTYANTLGALEEATELLERAMTVIDHLESVATNDALRAAYNATRPRVSAFWAGLAMNDGLYQAVRAFGETDEVGSLPPTERRFLEKTQDDFRRHGAELNPEDKAKLRAIETQAAAAQANRWPDSARDSPCEWPSRCQRAKPCHTVGRRVAKLRASKRWRLG